MNKDLTVGKPESVLWRFCLPLFGSVIFQQLYNIADSFVAGRYIGENALAAVGNSYEITLIFIAFAFGCNIGCSVIVSQLFGAKKYSEMKTAVSTTFVGCIVLVALLMAVGLLGGKELLTLINTPDTLMKDSLTYLNIYVLGLPFLLFYNVATGIFSAMGDSRTPFIFLAISSVSNIAVDILFVKGIGMGVEGVAWATFLCQGVSGILAVIVVIRRLAAVETEGKFVIFSAKMLKKIAIIAIPSILQQSFISVGNIIIQRVINQYGESVIAGYAAAVKLNNLVITSFTTIGNGISNYTAQNLGAGQLDRIRQGLKAGIKMIWELCLPFAVLYFFLGKYGMYPFMENKTGLAVDTGVTYLRILAPFYFVVSAKLVADGILRGTGMMGRFMVSTFTDLILRVVLAIVLSGAMQSATGIWMSWPIGWTVASVLSLVFCITGIKKLTEGQLMQGGTTSR